LPASKLGTNHTQITKLESHMSLSWVFFVNWNLDMLEKNPQSKARTNSKRNPHMAPGWNQTQATLVGGEHSHQCVIWCYVYVRIAIVSLTDRDQPNKRI